MKHLILPKQTTLLLTAVWVSRQLGLKKAKRDGKTKSEPWWKRRIEDSMKELNRNGEVKSKRKVEKLYEKFRIHQKGLGTVLEELKQMVLTKVAKIERYNERIKQFKQNRLFTIDQKKQFAELNGKTQESNEIPMQIKVECFAVAYGVKVKNIIEMQSG